MSARLQSLGKLEAKVVCQHIWGARQGHRDELILRDRDATTSRSESSGEFLNERLWCLMDYYDPTSIVDNGANIVERYRFSAFGQRSILAPDFSPLDTSGYDWDFAFKGQFLDLDTGYYNYGYRYYSPELGRWLSRDPMGEKGGLNLYDMCGNDPVNLYDYLGLEWKRGGTSVQFAQRDIPCECYTAKVKIKGWRLFDKPGAPTTDRNDFRTEVEIVIQIGDTSSTITTKSWQGLYIQQSPAIWLTPIQAILDGIKCDQIDSLKTKIESQGDALEKANPIDPKDPFKGLVPAQ